MLSVDSDLLAEGSSTGVRAAVEAEESMVYRKSRSERKKKKEKEKQTKKGSIYYNSTIDSTCSLSHSQFNFKFASSYKL